MRYVFFIITLYSLILDISGAGLRIQNGRAITIVNVTAPVIHAEGPHWDHEKNILYYVDISSSKVLKYNQSDETLMHFLIPPGNMPVSLVVPVTGSESELVITRGKEVVIYDMIIGNVSRQLGQVEDNKPGNRFNDGKADPAGRLWAGTMGPEEPGVGVLPDQGTLYVLNNTLFTAMVGEIDVSNGLAWSADNTKMYYVDTGTSRIDIFDYDIQTANISNRRVAFDFVANNASCSPDSMTIDTNDTLWVACWGGYKVVRIDPTLGQLIGNINLPVKYVTSVAWGGLNLTELFVTTSRRDLTPEEIQQQPMAGSVFKVTGLPASGFPAKSVIVV